MRIIVGLALGIAMLSAGCSDGGGEESGAARTTAAGPAAHAGGKGCDLPAEYAEMPVVPGCFHVSDYRIAVQASTILSQDEALAYFESALPKAGWKVTGRKAMEEGLIHLDLEGHGVRSAWVEVKARQSPNDRSIGVTYYVN